MFPNILVKFVRPLSPWVRLPLLHHLSLVVVVDFVFFYNVFDFFSFDVDLILFLPSFCSKKKKCKTIVKKKSGESPNYTKIFNYKRQKQKQKGKQKKITKKQTTNVLCLFCDIPEKKTRNRLVLFFMQNIIHKFRHYDWSTQKSRFSSPVQW